MNYFKKHSWKAKVYPLTLVFLSLIVFASFTPAKKKTNDAEEKDKSKFTSSTFSGLSFRSIGPAFASGRIAEFAVNPNDFSEYYVAVASGHVWKTVNAGITFEPVFEKYGAYSTGYITIDPNNSHVVWLGTGENNHQRALGYGNGVYKSEDGGKSWKNMGLKESRQIGGILIDPRNSQIVYVAAEGSAWGSGSERGLYKTTDGGGTWEKILYISENTGVNCIVMDPRDPDVIYASSEQRRRHVHTKIGGGPESAIYKTIDGGKNWEKLTSGLPQGHVGGMGLAISPANPDVIYAIIEAERTTGGFFRSTDRGASWTKMSDYNTSGQYYNTIYCDPKDVDKVYNMETVSQVTLDGGKTWNPIGNNKRHVDDHAMWIDPHNTDHFFIGGDGGIYETYDGGKNFHFKSNLPVTQFYRVNVDNAFPFYNVYGGTQDNNSFGGPNMNNSRLGVVEGEWYVTLGGDGFWQAIDPDDPNIVYSELQYGNNIRYDRKSDKGVSIKPIARKGEDTYKWNWNAPLIISPHSKTRLYFAANKVFRSDDRGNTWKVISDDLTAKIDRNTWPIMGKYWSVDAVAKDVSTSQFGAIVSFDESLVKEDLLYVGTDDGVISITGNAGEAWSQVKSFPGVPAYTYVSDIEASKFDENIVFATFDNRKRDDFKPYVLKSTDKGKTWTSIAGNLPGNETVHALEQDVENPDLLFVGTEFGLYFSIDGGKEWIRLEAGIPDIAVRDIVLQTKENDLVLATFGRGFYILDDYTPLRNFKKEILDKESHIFPIQDALMFARKRGKSAQGSTYWAAPNPPYGATFTYYLKEAPKTQSEIRREKEKELFKEGKPIPQLTWDEERKEGREEIPYLIFTVLDEQNNVVKNIYQKPSAGINRVTWDFTYEGIAPVALKDEKFDPFQEQRDGMAAMPGNYKVKISLAVDGNVKELTGPVAFKAETVNNYTFPSKDPKALEEFKNNVSELARTFYGSMKYAEELQNKVEYIVQTLHASPGATMEMKAKAREMRKEIDAIIFTFRGHRPKASWEEVPPGPMPLYRRMSEVTESFRSFNTDPTQVQKDNFAIVSDELKPLLTQLKKIGEQDMKALEKEMENIKAPWTPGRIPDLK